MDFSDVRLGQLFGESASRVIVCQSFQGLSCPFIIA